MAQLEDYGDLHPDAHMFFTKMQRENTDIITVNMTQLLIKAGLKELGGGSHNAVNSEMEQLHFRKMIKPMN